MQEQARVGRPHFEQRKPLVYAHRGANDVAPENTLSAFRAAIKAGADGIELDVTRCRTGEVIVIHDDVVDRTTNGSGRVETMSLDTLKLLDAGAWFGPEYAGEQIPTLDEVLDLVQHKLLVNIEIKAGRVSSNAGIEAEVARLVRERAMQDEIVVSSFNPAALRRMRQEAPEIRTALLYAPDLPFYLSRAWARHLLHPWALHPHQSQVNEQMLAWARRGGYRVNPWTVNQPLDMDRLVALGVDGIITDHPRRLLERLTRREADARK